MNKCVKTNRNLSFNIHFSTSFDLMSSSGETIFSKKIIFRKYFKNFLSELICLKKSDKKYSGDIEYTLVGWKQFLVQMSSTELLHTHTHTHTYIYIYIYSQRPKTMGEEFSFFFQN